MSNRKKRKKQLIGGEKKAMAIIRTLFRNWSIGMMVFIFGCERSKPNSPIEIYNSALNQLFDNHCKSCSKTDDFVFENYKRFASGKIDSAVYFGILDSLAMSEEKGLKKCFIEYTEDSDVFYRKNSKADSSIRESAISVIKSSQILVDFPTITVTGLLDSMMIRSGYKASDFHQECIEVVPYIANAKYPFENGIGVLTFSRMIFDKGRQKAILYYEFMCSRSCGRGEIVTMQLFSNGWKIVRREIIWQA